MAGLIGQQLGNYEIVSLLGRGGMATVYRARQLTIKREVAIKVIKSDLAESSDFVRRFEREAETIASLGHPHILKLFDYGQQGDMVYLVMELLKGGSLADLIRKGRLPLDTVSVVLDQISSALEYAHVREIIHRDLKPQNILLDGNGNAFLTDFGIARLVTQATALTQSGVAIGTPAYMAPEQWQSRFYDARADIYALGIVLFEMLIGRLPFDADTPARMIYLHLHESPPPASTLRSDLPLGVEGVIARALAKRPEDRFQSAEELARAFKAVLTGQSPVPASFGQTPVPSKMATPSALGRPSPTPVIESTVSAPRRSRSTLLGIGVVAIVLMLIGGLMAVIPGTRMGLITTPTPSNTEILLPTLPAVTLGTAVLPGTIATSRPTVTAPTNAQEPPTAVAIEPTFPEALAGANASGTATLTLPFSETPNFATRAAATLGERARLTAKAKPTLTPTQTPNEEQTINAMMNASDTAEAALSITLTASPSTTPKVSNTPISTQTVTTTLTTIADMSATSAVVPVPDLPAASGNAPPSITIAQVGTAAANSTPTPAAVILATSPMAPMDSIPPTPDLAQTATPSPSGTTTPSPSNAPTFTPASVAMAPTPSVISAANADLVVEVNALPPDIGLINAVAFSPDGTLLASGNASQQVRLWDLQANRQKAILSGHAEQVYSVAFSPDGKLLASGSLDGTVRLWDVNSGQVTIVLQGHTNGVRSVAFSPDGKLLASGAWDRTIRLWDIQTGKLTTILTGHSAGVQSVAFSPDGKLLVSGGLDGTVRLWDVQSGQQTAVLQGHTDRVSGVAFSPNGTLVASASWDRTVRLWEVQSGKQRTVLNGHTDIVLSLAFNLDGTLLASGSADKTIRLWDVPTGQEKLALQGHTNTVSSVAFSHDGMLLASSDHDKVVRLWGLRGVSTLASATPIPTSLSLTQIPCTVTTDSSNTVAIRVGPGKNRGLKDYMIANQPYRVTGQAQASDGSPWWKLKTDDDTEAWVAQTEVKAAGDCGQVSIVPTPPIVFAKPTATKTSTPLPAVVPSGGGNSGGGGNPPPQPTSPPGQPTYTPLPPPPPPPPTCNGQFQPCGTCCNAGLTCVQGYCTNCGGPGMGCCGGTSCAPGLTCTAGTCH